MNLFQFLVTKPLDPVWIRIRIGIQPKMLDPDPSCIDAGVRIIVTKSPKVGPLFIFSITLALPSVCSWVQCSRILWMTRQP